MLSSSKQYSQFNLVYDSYYSSFSQQEFSCSQGSSSFLQESSHSNQEIVDYVKMIVDMNIIGETVATFTNAKQIIFLETISLLVHINRNNLWFESLVDFLINNRRLLMDMQPIILDTTALNAIIGVSIDINNVQNFEIAFTNSVNDGSLITALANNGLTVQLELNEIALEDPNSPTDDTPPPSDDITDDDTKINKKALIGGIVGSVGMLSLLILYKRRVIKSVKSDPVQFSTNIVPATVTPYHINQVDSIIKLL